jgi:hypothetical protein
MVDRRPTNHLLRSRRRLTLESTWLVSSSTSGLIELRQWAAAARQKWVVRSNFNTQNTSHDITSTLSPCGREAQDGEARQRNES